MDIYVDKLYSSDRKDEPCSIGIPIKKGEIQNLDNVAVIQNNKSIPLQKKVTSRYDDGSVRFMFLRFLADLDANKKTVLKCIPNLTQDEKYPQKECDNIMTNESLIIDNDAITVDNGKLSFFCYKELPSLNRLGNNTLLLESLAIAYELTKDEKYLKYGEQTFKKAVSDNAGSSLGKKTIYDDAVVAGSGSTKNFGQSFIPLVTYYKAITDM